VITVYAFEKLPKLSFCLLDECAKFWDWVSVHSHSAFTTECGTRELYPPITIGIHSLHYVVEEVIGIFEG
jgi:hypothetical protein